MTDASCLGGVADTQRPLEGMAMETLDCLAEAVLVVDADLAVCFANQSARRLFAVGGGPVIDRRPALDLVVPADRDRVATELAPLLREPGAVGVVTCEARTLDGPRLVHAIVTNRIEHPAVGGLIVSVRAVTPGGECCCGPSRPEDAHRHGAPVHAVATRRPSAVETTADLVTIHAANGEIVDGNEAARLFLAGRRSVTAMFPTEVMDLIHLEALALGRSSWTGDAQVVDPDGHPIDVALQVTVTRDATGAVESYVVVARDLSDEHDVTATLAHQLRHDVLTGLLNRHGLVEVVDSLLGSAAAATISVLLLDLEGVKAINDSLGHDAADEVLQIAARRLRGALGGGILAHLGADQFAAVLGGITDPDDARAAADRVRRAVADPIDLYGIEVRLSASVGVVVGGLGAGVGAGPGAGPGVGDAAGIDRTEAGSDQSPGTVVALPRDADRLLGDAGLAVQHAKQRGRDRVELFASGMDASARRRLVVEAELYGAIARDELAVVYQPIVTIDGRELIGFEALVRWDHPIRGRLAPAEFLDVADEVGLTIAIDSKVLSVVCAQMAAWDVEHGCTDLTVSVNISPRSLARSDLADVVGRELKRWSIAPSRLHLEITEGQLMEDMEATIAALARLKELGVRLALDDFGMGYSSLAHVARFGVHTLKIDRAFVEPLGRDPHGLAVIRAISMLASSFGLATIVEGIETDEQLRHVAGLGLGAAQGYLFGRPLDAAMAGQRIVERH